MFFTLIRTSMYMLVKATPKVASSSTIRYIDYIDVIFLKYVGQYVRRTHFCRYHNFQI